MSLPSTAAVKTQLSAALGTRAGEYWESLQHFLAGELSRAEFEDAAREVLDSQHLVQLHNALIISLFDTSQKPIALTAGAAATEAPRRPPRKRRRVLPYQGDGPEDAEVLRSERLKHWTVSVGRKERERVRALEALEPRDTFWREEISRERGVVKLKERGEPPGSRLPLQLASATRAPTLQHISERVTLISAQHDLQAPPKTVAQLVMVAWETKIKELVAAAISLTASSRAIRSINSSNASSGSVLTLASFDALFTIAPNALPGGSAAAMRMALGEQDGAAESEARETNEPKEQLFALLAQRSAVREALRAAAR